MSKRITCVIICFGLQCADALASVDVEKTFRAIKLGMSSAKISRIIERPVQNFCNQSNDLVFVENKIGKFYFRINTNGNITYKSLLYNKSKDTDYQRIFKDLANKYDCRTNRIMKVEYSGPVVGFVPLSSVRQQASSLEETQSAEGLELSLKPRNKSGFYYYVFCSMQSQAPDMGGSGLCETSKLFCYRPDRGWSSGRF